jgi:hypothetical protein
VKVIRLSEAPCGEIHIALGCDLQHHPGMTTTLPDEAVQRVRAALQRSDKIEAIKVYREFEPVGLAEAKQAVEEMEALLFATHPHWYTRHTRFLRRAPSRGMRIFSIIGNSVGAVAYGMLAMSGPRVPIGEQSWHNSPTFFWAACIFFTIFALFCAGPLLFGRRKR